MAIDERSRNALFNRLGEVLGQEHATVLMSHLPPVGWADVATKHDLDQLETRLEARFEAKLHAALHSQLRSIVQWLIFATTASTFTVGALAFAAARLT